MKIPPGSQLSRSKRKSVFGLLSVVFGALLLSATLSSTAANAASGDSICVGERSDQISEAKDLFLRDCGDKWNDQNRDQCTYVNNPGGWVCHEYAADGESQVLRAIGQPKIRESPVVTTQIAAPQVVKQPVVVRPPSAKPAKPGVTDVVVTNSVLIEWEARSGVAGVEIYKNDTYQLTITSPTVEWHDRGGNATDKYELIAYNSNRRYSGRTTVIPVDFCKVNSCSGVGISGSGAGIPDPNRPGYLNGIKINSNGIVDFSYGPDGKPYCEPHLSRDLSICDMKLRALQNGKAGK